MTKEVASWKEAMAKAAGTVVKNEKVGGNRISTKGGHLTMNKEPLPNNKAVGVVVAAVTERAYYEEAYDGSKEDYTPPDCYAKSTFDTDMVPAANVPNPRSEACGSCPLAEFGSAPKGKGPACKTRRILALAPRDALEGGDLAVLATPPTSVKNWQKYATKLGHAGVAPWGVVTEVGAQPSKFMYELTFTMVEPLLEEEMPQAFSRIEEAETLLMEPHEYE